MIVVVVVVVVVFIPLIQQFDSMHIKVGRRRPALFRFDLIGFYRISTIVGYLMPNTLYTYTLNIYDLVWLGFMAYQPL